MSQINTAQDYPIKLVECKQIKTSIINVIVLRCDNFGYNKIRLYRMVN
jgi:hypothetical protein